jgi:hypothetical protein
MSAEIAMYTRAFDTNQGTIIQAGPNWIFKRKTPFISSVYDEAKVRIRIITWFVTIRAIEISRYVFQV